ncbi:hypothetical protein [Photobacterium rosenbergii]|uniref:Uncharacterized protein n=1 Tax=Photobacterium rosenbergii TaxID=294936 RepID=A0ABU3ZBM6_9GAMM|nr:hypothetical protein [Photobacterium rosenbergii]MDV5167512.1 hypothetical protein [Photobacterium rosenbergii]
MGKSSVKSAKAPATKKPTTKAPAVTSNARRPRRGRAQATRVTARPSGGKGRRPTLAENFRGKSGGGSSSGAKTAKGNLARRENISELRTTSLSKTKRMRRS